SGGARAENIVWQVAGLIALGSTAHAEGVLLAKTAITLASGASVQGRLLAQTAVTLISNDVTAPGP
ncbi:MAG: large protein, partial [Myxococcaceae bacterium]|nr:large protein [Myxococcaceae bacterium]